MKNASAICRVSRHCRRAGILSLAALLSAFVGRANANDVAYGIATPAEHDVIPRFFHKAGLLPDGRVLVTGGLGLTLVPAGLTALSDVSVFNPQNGRFERIRSPNDNTPAALLRARSSHTQTTLLDGRVLIAGGNVDATGVFTGRTTVDAELFDPVAGVSQAAPPMNERRAFHSATRLSDGRVVIAGGATWQVFDPANDTWSAPVPMRATRIRHAAVLLPATATTNRERVLVIGGLGSGGRMIELIDAANGESHELSVQLPFYVNDLAAARLADGRVLIVGGQLNAGLQTVSDSFLLDVESEMLHKVDSPPERLGGISDHELFPFGLRAIVFGGEQQREKLDTELDYVAVFDGSSERWEFVGRLRQQRDDFAAVCLDDRRVMLIGGAFSLYGTEAPTASTEIFELFEATAGDLDADGHVSWRDVSPFVDVLLEPQTASARRRRVADLNGDLRIDALDIEFFAMSVKTRS